MRFGHSEEVAQAKLTFLPLEGWTNRQQDGQTDRHTDRQTDRHINRNQTGTLIVILIQY